MDWMTVVNLIAQVGYPLACELIDKINKNEPYSPAEWAALRKKIETKVFIPIPPESEGPHP